jgi:hypothetical protein
MQFTLICSLQARRLIIELVLSTDVARHGESMAALAAARHSGSAAHSSDPWKDADDATRLLYLQLMLKLADMGNPGRPVPVAVRWATAIVEEFCQQVCGRVIGVRSIVGLGG